MNILIASSVTDAVNQLQKTILSNRLTPENLLYSVLILVASILVANFLSKLFSKTLLKYVKNRAARAILTRIIKYGIIIIGLTIALSFIGVDLGWFSIVFALFVFMIYLTLRPLVENMGAGLLIQARPSFSIGSRVKLKDFTGEVVDINSRSTVIKTDDHKMIHIPNTMVLDQPITVCDALPQIESSITLKLSSKLELDKLEKDVMPRILKIDGILDVPKPGILITDIETDKIIVSISWWHSNKHSIANKTKDLVAREVLKLK